MMKVSKLIERLQDMQQQFGDVPVRMAHEIRPNEEALEIPIGACAIRAGLQTRIVIGEHRL